MPPTVGEIEMKRQETERPMRNELTAIFERDGEWHIANCPEIPGANGQDRTKAEARRSLADAIALILEDRRRDGCAVCREEPSARGSWSGEAR
jgi:predicted RNase H-like HicB family nuclease